MKQQPEHNFTAYLLIGGNIGERKSNLQTAAQKIEELCGNILQTSSIYETAAWGFTDQPNFYNQVLKLNTQLSPEKLMLQLLAIEETMGRKRMVKMGPRTIDLDILLIDDLIIHSELLHLPHPQLPNRRFALLPLAEIAPNLIHPVEKKTISTLLQQCKDNLNVQKI